MKARKERTTAIAVAGCVMIAVILVLGTVWMGQSAKKDTDEAVRSVSLLYLDELTDRREQVVENNLQEHIQTIKVAISLMTETDLDSPASLAKYQSHIKQLFNLEKFAFVDTSGLIYTSVGTRTDIGDYSFDYRSLSGPDISVKNIESPEKKVVIAMPVSIPFNGDTLSVCFMEMDMKVMLAGAAINTGSNGSTFCNIYTRNGIALTNTILGGLSAEDNLLDAMAYAELDNGCTYSGFLQEFQSGGKGSVSFTYKNVRETLSYFPISGTDWLLTYLIRESVISDRVGHISSGIVTRSLVQSILTVAVLAAIFAFILNQLTRNNKLQLERETAEAEIRGKQVELEQRIALQQQLEQQSQTLSEALKAAEQANKAKTSFLSNMSHEIRTPMNAIIGLDNIALNDPQTPEKTREYLQKIGSSAGHMLDLINDILDMSRIESGRMVLKNEEFSFPKLLEALNTLFSAQAADKSLDYSCRILSEVDDYYIGDSMKLRQVLINILSNAVKFTPPGGKIGLEIERKAKYDGKTALCFTIRDTGIGISREYLPRIFEAFSQEDSSSTNKYGSSGLGLAITKSIVEMMNGDIRVQSEKGKGTVFTVTVTLSDSARTDSGNDPAEIPPGAMTVLIVDDDPIACEHARLVLEKAGIASETAASGAEAIDMVTLRHARMDSYNLILIDWKMPEMDGVETARRIRSVIGAESAIIMLTAYRWDDVLEEALQAGVDSFIPKPLFAAAVLEEFRSALKRKHGFGGQGAGKADLAGRRVLLAEDMEVNAEIITMVLEMRGIQADLAENGRIALEKFESSAEGTYDAILMDMRMPEMDGLEATRRIRALDRKDAAAIPIIALTANAFDEDVQRSLQAGLNAHLSKPVQPDTLFETLESLIKE